MNKELKEDYRDKLRRFLATPHSAKAYFDLYKDENKHSTFDDYTHKLAELLDSLDEGEFDKHSEFCAEIKKLKLPHNQFGC